MALGQRILQARQELGLSQRQLCGDVITRNMLSQIEHGSARPSMDTLRYLAGRLKKPVSYFLEEEQMVSPNQTVLLRVRLHHDAGEFALGLEALADFCFPDGVLEREARLLEVLCLLGAAEEAAAEKRDLYALELLEKAGALLIQCSYCTEELARRRLLLLGRISRQNLSSVTELLPPLDEELYLRGRAVLETGDAHRAGIWLDGMEDQSQPEWHLLRGRAYLLQGAYALAAQHLHWAEEQLPEETAPYLECCYREQGNFERAYFYACKQK